jgi:hypothetical protein
MYRPLSRSIILRTSSLPIPVPRYSGKTSRSGMYADRTLSLMAVMKPTTLLVPSSTARTTSSLLVSSRRWVSGDGGFGHASKNPWICRGVIPSLVLDVLNHQFPFAWAINSNTNAHLWPALFTCTAGIDIAGKLHQVKNLGVT